MELTPREKDKLLIFTAALLTERRMAGRQDRRGGDGRSQRLHPRYGTVAR